MRNGGSFLTEAVGAGVTPLSGSTSTGSGRRDNRPTCPSPVQAFWRHRSGSCSSRRGNEFTPTPSDTLFEELKQPAPVEQLEMTMPRWFPDGQSAPDGADAPSVLHPDDESGEAANALHLLDLNTLSALMSLGGDDDAEWLGELVDLFAKEAPRLISLMREAARRGDDEELWRSAHSLKGSSGNLGATSLASLAPRLSSGREPARPTAWRRRSTRSPRWVSVSSPCFGSG